MSEWYYTRAGQQVGPVTSPQLRQAARSGELAPTDLVWKDGMAEWAPAGKINGLFASAPAAAAPVAAPAAAQPVAAASAPDTFDLQPVADNPAPWQSPQPHHAAGGQPAAAIGYYNPTAGLSQRVAQNLQGFPPPTGPQGDWPLSDMHLAQLIEAEKQRKLIRSCANLFNALCLLYVIVAVVMAFASVAAVSFGPRGRAGTFAGGFMLAFTALAIGLALLAFFAKRAVLRCRSWAPITFIALFSLGIVVNLIGMVAGGGGASGPGPRPDAVANTIGGVFGIIITALFIWPCARALAAIPRFLACPVWAQEALVAAKL
jgi:MFS family permease